MSAPALWRIDRLAYLLVSMSGEFHLGNNSVLSLCTSSRISHDQKPSRWRCPVVESSTRRLDTRPLPDLNSFNRSCTAYLIDINGLHIGRSSISFLYISHRGFLAPVVQWQEVGTRGRVQGVFLTHVDDGRQEQRAEWKIGAGPVQTARELSEAYSDF